LLNIFVSNWGLKGGRGDLQFFGALSAPRRGGDNLASLKASAKVDAEQPSGAAYAAQVAAAAE